MSSKERARVNSPLEEAGGRGHALDGGRADQVIISKVTRVDDPVAHVDITGALLNLYLYIYMYIFIYVYIHIHTYINT